jgi:hypothetical protein
MAQRHFVIKLQRTQVEVCNVGVMANSRQEAAFLAAKETPEWMPESDSVKVVSVDLDE